MWPFHKLTPAQELEKLKKTALKGIEDLDKLDKDREKQRDSFHNIISLSEENLRHIDELASRSKTQREAIMKHLSTIDSLQKHESNK